MSAAPCILDDNVQPMLSQWLDLAFADRDRIEAVVNEALALQPNISANEFRRFVEGRARAIQNIAAFLVANMTFTEEEDAATRVGSLRPIHLPITSPTRQSGSNSSGSSRQSQTRSWSTLTEFSARSSADRRRRRQRAACVSLAGKGSQ
jgi:hypothetical protein